MYWESKKPIPMEIERPASPRGPSREDWMKEDKGPDIGPGLGRESSLGAAGDGSTDEPVNDKDGTRSVPVTAGDNAGPGGLGRRAAVRDNLIRDRDRGPQGTDRAGAWCSLGARARDRSDRDLGLGPGPGTIWSFGQARNQFQMIIGAGGMRLRRLWLLRCLGRKGRQHRWRKPDGIEIVHVSEAGGEWRKEIRV